MELSLRKTPHPARIDSGNSGSAPTGMGNAIAIAMAVVMVVVCAGAFVVNSFAESDADRKALSADLLPTTTALVS